MTPQQYKDKKKKLIEHRKELKYKVVYDDSATRIHNLKELIESEEKELKAHENRIKT